MNRPYGPDPRATRAKSIGREKVLSREATRFPQTEAGPAGARQGAPTRNQTDGRPKKQRPPTRWKPRRLWFLRCDAHGFGPGNAVHFSLALAYLAQSEGGQDKFPLP